MCGRYRLSRRKQLVEEYFDASGDEDWSPRYNIAPTQPVPVIRQHPKEPRRELSLVRWGLIPSCAKDTSGSARMTITTCNVLEMLGEWKIAHPYNFLLLPMVDPLFGFAFHRQSNEKVLLICPFSSKQDQWIGLECVNVHNDKKYKMLNCKKTNGNIPYNVVFPSQFAHLLIQYQQHSEAKSLAPNGTACCAETKGLLRRAHVIAGEIRYIGKETDRKWEEGDDISVLEFAATEYGRKGKVIASEDVKAQISSIGINKCARESGFDRKNFVRKLVRGLPVKRNSYEELGRWLQTYKTASGAKVSEGEDSNGFRTS